MPGNDKDIKTIKFLILLFIVGLVLSGITAFPLITELRILNSVIGPGSLLGSTFPELADWIKKVYMGLAYTQTNYPFIQYGTDWLAFAHLVIAAAFWGPFIDPVRNKWVIDFGIIACLGIIPLALICGSIREIPFYWRMIDISFGIFGSIPLLIIRSLIRRIEINLPRNIHNGSEYYK